MSAAAAAGTRAAAGERRRTEPAQASGRGGRCGRSARTQTVEAEDAVTVVPPEATEEGLLEVSPDTLCATGSLAPTRFPPPSSPTSGCGCSPSPTRAGGNRPSSPPAASAFRGPGTRLGVPPLPGAVAAGCAPRGTGAPRAGVGRGPGWLRGLAKMESRLYPLNPLRLGTHS